MLRLKKDLLLRGVGNNPLWFYTYTTDWEDEIPPNTLVRINKSNLNIKDNYVWLYISDIDRDEVDSDYETFLDECYFEDEDGYDDFYEDWTDWYLEYYEIPTHVCLPIDKLRELPPKKKTLISQ